MSRVFELDLTLLGVTPRVWRHVRVPAAMTLDDLHHVIQVLMDWDDYHLHLFEVGDHEYGTPPDEDEQPEQTRWAGDDARISIAKAFAQASGSITYIYDFGDDWRIDISMLSDSVTSSMQVECLAGGGAAPPEGSGGPAAYQQMRQNAPDDIESMRFDVDAANARLRAAEATPRVPKARKVEFAPFEVQLQADVTLLALFLASWQEGTGQRVAWKHHAFHALNTLQVAGLLETTPARQSVLLTDEGVRRAEQLRARIAALLSSRT